MDETLFQGDDPIGIVNRWMEEGRAAEPSDANAVALATVDEDGLPNCRIVLIKEIGPKGFVFYTNYESAKGRELSANPQAAFVMHWKSLGRQIRVRGEVVREDGPAADAYYASRPLDARLGAWASRQSRPLTSRAALMEEVARYRGTLGEEPARPPHWGGFRVVPSQMEFWAEGAFRLHDRFRWSRTKDGWQVDRLNP